MSARFVKPGKTIISWTFWCVDISVDKYYSTDFISKPTQIVKTFQKHLYIDYNKLSAKDKIFVDIAKEKQKYFDDPSYFFQLRHLFIEGFWSDIENVTNASSVTSSNYYEDMNGKWLTEKQFVEMSNNSRNLRKTFDGTWVPDNLSEDAACTLKLYDHVKFAENKFILNDKQVHLLNLFIQDAINIRNSSLMTQNRAVTLNMTLHENTIVRNISDEQYIASLVSYRRLYMENEPACFNKVVKLLRNKHFIMHPIINSVNKIKEQYDHFLKSSITSLDHSGNLIKSSLKSNWCPSGKELIDIMLYTGIIHQGEEKTLALKEQILLTLPDEALLEWIFIDLFNKTARCMIKIANIAIKILNAIGKLKIKIPEPNKDNKEADFEKFLLEKTYHLAQILWEENERPDSGFLQYESRAKKEINEMFSIK